MKTIAILSFLLFLSGCVPVAVGVGVAAGVGGGTWCAETDCLHVQ